MDEPDGSNTRRPRIDLSAKAKAARESDNTGRRRRPLEARASESDSNETAPPRLVRIVRAQKQLDSAASETDTSGRRRRKIGAHDALREARASTPTVPLRIIDNPAAFVMVVPDALGGLLSNHDRDVLGAARSLADACHGAVLAVASVTNGVLAEAGADREIEWPKSLSPEIYQPDGRVAYLRAIERSFNPRHILFCDTIEGQDLALRLAADLGEQPMTHLNRVRAGEVTRRPCGDKLEQVAQPGRILTVAAGGAEPVLGERFEARRLSPPSLPDVAARVRDLGQLPIDPYRVALEEAPFVVSAGNGLSDWHGFKTLVKCLGAAPAGTRVVCDAGHLPRDRQVGTSGRTITADCYLALGISGAIQHLQGIEECVRVLAVNTDPHAPIVKRANLTVIGDVNEIVAALVERLQGKPQCR